MRALAVLALCFFIAVAVAPICNRVPPVEAQRPTTPGRASMTTQPQPVLPANARHVADVTEAVVKHDANAARTGKVFDGKPVTVYGRVFRVEGQEDRGFVVFLRDVRDGTFSLMLTCHFAGTSKEQLGKLNVDQTILIRSQSWGPAPDGKTVMALGCELVTVPRLRAQEAP